MVMLNACYWPKSFLCLKAAMALCFYAHVWWMIFNTHEDQNARVMPAELLRPMNAGGQSMSLEYGPKGQ